MSIAPPRIACLESARAAVLERSDDYGLPEDLFKAIAARWTLTLRAKLDVSIEARDVALMMIDLKVERAIAGKHQDNWVDCAGYASLGYQLDSAAMQSEETAP
jgi:hypothetical protein